VPTASSVLSIIAASISEAPDKYARVKVIQHAATSISISFHSFPPLVELLRFASWYDSVPQFLPTSEEVSDEVNRPIPAANTTDYCLGDVCSRFNDDRNFSGRAPDTLELGL
jgi:hypothetical protein